MNWGKCWGVLEWVEFFGYTHHEIKAEFDLEWNTTPMHVKKTELNSWHMKILIIFNKKDFFKIIFEKKLQFESDQLWYC